MMNKLIDILHTGHHSLVVDNGEIHTYDGRGVSDLFRLYKNNPEILAGAKIADKVVGKGAAALMIVGKVSRVHADVISVPALALFRTSPVDVDYDKLVDNIINRHGTGICPVETLCLECRTADECLPKIENFINSNKLQ